MPSPTEPYKPGDHLVGDLKASSVKTFVTSDLHIGDVSIAKRRYFGDVSHHDRALARYWDTTVEETDTVYLLGDVILGHISRGLNWYHDRPGKKILISGNWDKSHAMNGHDPSWHRTAGGPFEQIWDEANLLVKTPEGATEFYLSHYPYRTSKEIAANKGIHRPVESDEPRVLLHGHTHQRKQVSFSELGTLQLHVGWDAWRAFVPMENLVDAVERILR